MEPAQHPDPGFDGEPNLCDQMRALWQDTPADPQPETTDEDDIAPSFLRRLIDTVLSL